MRSFARRAMRYLNVVLQHVFTVPPSSGSIALDFSDSQNSMYLAIFAQDF